MSFQPSTSPHPSLFLHFLSKIAFLHSHTLVTVFGYVAVANACVTTSETRMVKQSKRRCSFLKLYKTNPFFFLNDWLS